MTNLHGDVETRALTGILEKRQCVSAACEEDQPNPLLGCLTPGQHQGKSNGGAVPKRLLRLPHPKVNKEILKPDSDVAEGLIMPSSIKLVDRDMLRRRQQESKSTHPDGLTLTTEVPQLLVNGDGKIWVPDEDKELQSW